MEVFQLWLICTVSISVMVVIPYMLPAFGPVIHIPTYAFAIIGLLLYLISFGMNRVYRITK